MLRSKRVFLLTLIVLAVFTALVCANTLVAQTSTLSGVVSSNNLIKTGAIVKEGQVLVYIDSIAGPAPAARATVDGMVSEVLVKAGDKIVHGQTVVRITSNK